MLYVVYCRIDELMSCNKGLAEKLFAARAARIVARVGSGSKVRKTSKGGADIEDGPYAYHLTASGYVLRAPKELKAFMYRRDVVERYHRGKEPNQQLLSVQPQEVPTQ
jgi:hypothetical protein